MSDDVKTIQLITCVRSGPACIRLGSVIRALQTSMMVLLTKLVNNVNLKTGTIFAKRLILDAWLGPERASAD